MINRPCQTRSQESRISSFITLNKRYETQPITIQGISEHARALYGFTKTLFYSFYSFCFFVFGADIHSDNVKHGSEDVAVSVVVGVVYKRTKEKWIWNAMTKTKRS